MWNKTDAFMGIKTIHLQGSRSHLNLTQKVAVHRILFFVQLQIYDFYGNFLFFTSNIQQICE